MKKMTKKAVISTTAVKVEDKKATNSTVDQNKVDQKVEVDEITEKVIADIYKNIKNDKICLYYACIGYDFSSGKPIYDYNILVDLLINYGYTINFILEFIERFANNEFYDNGEKPCIISGRYRDEMYSCVEPLKNNICNKLKNK